jgi:Flp pilus assembly pilin Flp
MQSITTQAQDKSLELAVRAEYAVMDLFERIAERLRDEEGQTAIEYAGILAFVGLCFFGIFQAHIGTKVAGWAAKVVEKIDQAAGL